MPVIPPPVFPPAAGTVQSAGDLIRSAFRLIGMLASGELPEAAEAQDALASLNQMMDVWNAERMMIFTIKIEEFPLVVGQQTYLMGPGGDFNTVRPAKIERMGIVSLNNPAQPLELPIEMLNAQLWAQIPVKLISSTLPLRCYVEYTWPSVTLNFRYLPQVPVNTRIYSWVALSQFQDLDTPYTFPPAYYEAIRYNLAVRLQPEFMPQFPLNQVTAQLAVDSKATVKRMNTPLVDLYCDPAVVWPPDKRVYNWLTDNAVGR